MLQQIYRILTLKGDPWEFAEGACQEHDLFGYCNTDIVGEDVLEIIFEKWWKMTMVLGMPGESTVFAY